jgi:outer membrane lipase/esterase
MESSLGQLIAMLKDGSSSGGQSPGSTAIGGGAGDSPPSGAPSRWGFFVNGSLRRGSQDTTTEETGFDFRSNGVTAGADYRVTNSIVIGIAAGHSNGNTSFTDGSGRLDSRSNTGSLYGSYYNEAFYVDVIGTFGHITYAAARTTAYTIDPAAGTAPNCIGTTCTIDTVGSTGARQLAFGSSTGYSFYRGGFIFGPDLALDYTRVDVNGFTESDPSQTGMALVYGDQAGESLLLKGGGHFSYAISTPIAVVLPQVRARYIHEFKNDQRALNVHFVDDPTVTSVSGPISTFNVFTDRPDRGYFDWSAGVTAQFKFGVAAFVDYSSLAGYSQLQTHELSFGIRIQHLVR